MGLLSSIELTLTTLMVFLLIPFLTIAYRVRYSDRPELAKGLDFFVLLGLTLLGSFVVAKIVVIVGTGEFGRVKLAVLHFAPVALSILYLRSRDMHPVMRQVVVPEGGGGAAAEAGYAPLPVNSQIEKLTWDDMVIDRGLREELQSVISLLKEPEHAERYGIEVPKGILLSGPPGTGKTTIAKVIASTAQLSFFALKLDEVVSQWVGESEKNLTKLFQSAQEHAPSVIFIDEVDSIGKQRSGKQAWADNLLNHLLQLIDGVVKTEGLYIIAATNRPELVDEALKRPGRLNKVIEVPLPDFQSRKKLFKLYLSKLRISANLNFEALAFMTENRSAADIKAICNQAGLNAFKRESGVETRSYQVTPADLEAALSEFLSDGRKPVRTPRRASGGG